MARGQKKFKPFKQYRYLPGEIPLMQCKKDLDFYNVFRFRCYSAPPIVDSKAPKMNPRNHFNGKRLVSDAMRLRQIDKENKDLLKKINIINRKGGSVDSYNPLAYRRGNNWKSHNNDMKILEQRNKEFYDRLCSIQSGFNNQYLEECWKITLDKISHSCRFPIILLQKKSIDESIRRMPSISKNLNYSEICQRPLCFLEFKVAEGPVLGKIVLELYYDHVPVTVQNFLELCKGTGESSYKNCLVHRIVKDQFMESGDITLGTGKGGISIYGESFPEEKHVLSHTKPGVISMKRVGWAENNSQFCIAFNKLDKLDHMNVVFGHTVRGNDVLFKINEYSRKIGKPLEKIIISNCGELPKIKNKE